MAVCRSSIEIILKIAVEINLYYVIGNKKEI